MGGENTIIILSKRTESIHKTLCRKTKIGVPMFLKKNTSFKSKQGICMVDIESCRFCSPIIDNEEELQFMFDW
jgi:hypothetical protein